MAPPPPPVLFVCKIPPSLKGLEVIRLFKATERNWIISFIGLGLSEVGAGTLGVLDMWDKGPVYLFAIGQYVRPDTQKNQIWRIIAITSCIHSCARINKLLSYKMVHREICHHLWQSFFISLKLRISTGPLMRWTNDGISGVSSVRDLPGHVGPIFY